MAAVQSVQCFGKKKTATAVAHCRQGKGLIRVNGKPLSLVQPQVLRFKVYEPLLILGLDKFGMSYGPWREDDGHVRANIQRGGSNSTEFVSRTYCGSREKVHSLLTLAFAADVDIRVRVRGGGHTSQVYAIRQAIAKSIVCSSHYRSFDTSGSNFYTNSLLKDRLLPEIHRRAQQKPTEAGSRSL